MSDATSTPQSGPSPDAVAGDPGTGIVTANNVDLSNCDLEQVQLVGAIQPHGALLVIHEPELVIVQASANTATILGLPSETLLGQRIDVLLGVGHTRALSARLAAANLTGVLAHLLCVPSLPHRDVPFHVFGNRIEGHLLLEFEHSIAVARPVSDRLSDLRDTLQQLQGAASLSLFLDLAVQRMRALTGFERVMAYRFDADGSGEVVAEARAPDLEPYLGLHYPASDIPAPARRLFALSALRHLPDVDYQPVPLLPDRPPTGLDQPLDLSYSFLRSVSEMYSGYLRNMGVKAALVAPLLKDGKLWGLISCMHHSAPKYLSYEERIPVEFLAQMMSLLMGDREDLDHYAYREQLDRVLGQLVGALGRNAPFKEVLTAGTTTLLSVIDADGVALIAEGEQTLLGTTPLPDQVDVVAQWLAQSDAMVFATDRLPSECPAAAAFSAVAGGLLTIRLSRANADRVIWFRAEVLVDVHWAGDPNKPVEIDAFDRAVRLRPRTSFALWRETVRGRSRPWLDCELDHANRLRQAVLDVIAERARVLARINAELERSNLELDSFAYAASHDLKEPLRGIHNFAEFLKTEEGARLSERGRQRLETILRLAGRMDDLLESLLQYSRVFRNELDLGAYPIGALVEQTVEFLRHVIPDGGIDITIQPSLPVVRCDRMRAAMIFHNLVMNAIKYNRQAVKQIAVGCDAAPDPPVFFVRDNGIGIEPKHCELIFELFRRLHGREEFGGGTGAGLTIAKKAVLRHGGRIWVESAVGKGSTFYFTLAPERAPVAAPR
jgi:two-component system, chemotaxis family, sensor kinase Cph1